MKILQIIHKLQNRGAEIFACQLSNHLLDQGHEIKIVALYSGKANLPFKGEIILLNAAVKSSLVDYPAWKKLAKLVRSYNPDIIQANSGDTLKYAVLSRTFYGWKNPIVFRNASEVGRYLNSKIHKLIYTYFYNKVSQVISVSKASEKDFLKHFPAVKGITNIIPVGLENVSHIPAITLEPEHKIHIIHVGGFSFEKNHLGLLNIFRNVVEVNPQVHLHLIGDGELRPEIQQKVKGYKIEDNITFYGFLDEPLSYIKAADLLILPSIIEGLPGVLLEAMYCKTPVIAYNVGGVAEIVTAQTGYLITKNKERDFSKKILQAIEKTPGDIIENAYNMVNSSYMNTKIAADFAFTYGKVLERKMST